MKKKEWVGKKFDMLTIAKELPSSKFEVLCDCGSKFEIPRNIVYKKYFKSCGCNRIDKYRGQRYGMLVVLSDYTDITKNSMRYCTAKCDCGGNIITRVDSLISGYTTSCGCVKSKSKNIKDDLFSSYTPESLYWAGFIAADGNIKDKYLRISLQSKDEGHLHKLNNLLGTEYRISQRTSNKSHQIQIHSDKICSDLHRYGITERKSLTYQPTEICLSSPDFWRGMIDGDGCISQSRAPYKYPIIHFCGTIYACKGFCDFVKSFCRSGASPSINGNVYQISYSGKYAIQIMQKLYGNNPKFYLDRKYELANRFCNFDSENNQL